MTDDAIEHLRADPALAPLIDEHGELTIEPAADPFERLTSSIINQQLSSASAAAIRSRVFDRVEVTPTGILDADDEVLYDAGLSRQKVRYLRNIAEAFIERGLGRDYFSELSDDEVLADLTSITGIGDWTTKMFLIFSLCREDVFPVEDLGIRKGMWALFDPDMTEAAMTETAERWRPYRSYASRYIWRAYDG